jgi:hypothetical protein
MISLGKKTLVTRPVTCETTSTVWLASTVPKALTSIGTSCRVARAIVTGTLAAAFFSLAFERAEQQSPSGASASAQASDSEKRAFRVETNS